MLLILNDHLEELILHTDEKILFAYRKSIATLLKLYNITYLIIMIPWKPLKGCPTPHTLLHSDTNEADTGDIN